MEWEPSSTIYCVTGCWWLAVQIYNPARLGTTSLLRDTQVLQTVWQDVIVWCFTHESQYFKLPERLRLTSKTYSVTVMRVLLVPISHTSLLFNLIKLFKLNN